MSDDIAELQRQNDILKQAVEQSRHINKKYDDALLLIKQKDKELKQSYTELKDMQDEIVKREKMAALGSLVAGVAHEVNTPLGVSVTSASVLLNDCKKIKKSLEIQELTEEDLQEFLDSSVVTCELLLRNLENAAKLVQGFKQISVDQISDQKRMFNVKTYLEEIALTFHAQLKKIAVNVEIHAPDNIVIESYAGAFSQIFSNLIQNAINHAFDGKKDGTITINVVDKQLSLEIEFIDNGNGINEEIKDKIFEPFVTTKRGQGGSGLGLSIVYNLVTNMFNGIINLQSRQDAGTQFNIILAKN